MVHRTEGEDGSKTFRQQFGKNKWKKPKTFEYIPYRLVPWSAQMPPVVFIAEGERCVDVLVNELGLAATCNAGGAGRGVPSGRGGAR